MDAGDFDDGTLLEWWVSLGASCKWHSCSPTWPWEWKIVAPQGFGRYLALSYQIPVNSGTHFVNIEIHIVFHPVYQVPTLYFNIYRPNGTRVTPNEGKEFLSFFPEKDFGSFVTQAEHVCAQKPFLFIPPCRTHEFMQQFKASGATSGAHQYLLTWFNVYGAFLKLGVPPAFFQSALQGLQ